MNEDNQDIIIGKAKELLKEQKYEEDFKTQEPLSKEMLTKQEIKEIHDSLPSMSSEFKNQFDSSNNTNSQNRVG